MKPGALFATLLLAAAVLTAGCSLPRIPVRQTFDRLTTLTAGDARIHIYRARVFVGVDSSQRILNWEYLPIEIAALTDDRDSVAALLVAAWQEYLWRFSERLAPRDKEYFVPSIGSISAGGDSLSVVWLYPNVDNRDDDLRQVTPYRNSYWSVELFERGSSRELDHSRVRSHPQFTPYEPRSRFVPGGAFELGLPDSAAPMSTYRRELLRYGTPAGD